MKKSLVTLFFVLCASSASAIEKPFYVKGAFGRVDSDLQASAGAKYSKPNGYSVTFGYRLNDLIALEAGKLDLGKATARFKNSVDYSYPLDEYTEVRIYDSSGSTYQTANSIGLGTAFSFKLPADFTARLRLGGHQWCQREQMRLAQVGTITAYDDLGNLVETREHSETIRGMYHDRTGFDPYYGISIDWSLAEWTLGLEHNIFEMDDHKPSISALALTYSF